MLYVRFSPPQKPVSQNYRRVIKNHKPRRAPGKAIEFPFGYRPQKRRRVKAIRVRRYIN